MCRAEPAGESETMPHAIATMIGPGGIVAAVIEPV